jgi:putative tryptophan/tyrosine transport system substrate-binding protein
MRRREFTTLFGCATVWPLTARAQLPTAIVGYLGSESPELFASRLRAFREGLRATGYDEGQNLAIEYRWAEGRNDRLPGLAAELVGRQVSVIVAPGSLASALAAKAATMTIPVIFETGADPVRAGLVASLNQPGGNLTGVTSLNAQVGPKRLELLHEVSPSATVFAALVNPTNPIHVGTTKDLQAAAAARGLRLHVFNASAEEEFDAVFARVVELRAGLVIANEIYFSNRSEQLAALAVRHAVAAVHQSPEFAKAGGLMSYGGSISESHRQLGMYTGRVLKGEKPTNLPVQQVTKVELVINLKAAKALGLAIPPTLLARADEVIE